MNDSALCSNPVSLLPSCPASRPVTGSASRWAVLLVAALAAAPASAAEPSVFTAPAMVKIQPGAQPRPLLPARIEAARNEFEAFQIVIHGGDRGVTGLSARAGPLTGPGGATVPASSIWLYRQDLLEVTRPSGTIGAVGRWPDPLVPAVDEIDGEARSAFPFSVRAGEARALWVDVLVPLDARAGLYQGSVELTGDGFARSVPVELEVWPFSLPSTPSLASAFLLYAPNVCQAHTGRGDCGGASRAADLVGKYQRMALDHRLTLPNVFVLRNQGSDWTAFDRAFGPLLDGTAPTRLAGARMTSAQYPGEVSEAGYRAFGTHFRERGWIDRLYDYTADEPPAISPWSAIAPRARLVKAGDPAIKVLVTTTLDEARSHGLAETIDLMVPPINFMQRPGQPSVRPVYDGFVAGGRGLWMYQSCMSHSCGPGSPTPGVAWPSYMVDVSAMRNRTMQWADFKMRVTGELYYETAMTYREDPWRSVFAFSGNGDGTLFYPGTPARIGGSSQVPVASIRLKMIREGMEDFEYLTRVSELGDPALAHQVAESVLPTLHAADGDPERLVLARRTLARRILELAPPPPPDEGPGPDRPSDEGGPGAQPRSDPVPSPEPGWRPPLPGCASGGLGGAGAGLLLLGLPGLLARRRRTPRPG